MVFKEVFAMWKAAPSLSDLGRGGLRLREIETPSSAAKGKAKRGKTRRTCGKTSTHSNGSKSVENFGEALRELMKEVGDDCSERGWPIPDLEMNEFGETLLLKMDENEDEAEETPSSTAKGKANGGITRSCEETSTHSNGSESEDDFGEALQEMMKEDGNNCRERRRRPIPGKPSSSLNNVLQITGGELSVLGMGGIGETTIQNNGTTIHYTIGTLQMTNHHHYNKQERDEDD